MFDLVRNRTLGLRAAGRLKSILADYSNCIGEFGMSGMPVAPTHNYFA